jgi:hypothetical protein
MKKVIAFVFVSVFFMSCAGTAGDNKSNTALGVTSFVKVFTHWSKMEEGELSSHAEFQHVVTFLYDPNGKSSVQIKNDVSPLTQIYRQHGEIRSDGKVYGFYAKNGDGHTLEVFFTKDNSAVMLTFTPELSWVYSNMTGDNSASL